jgi:hypothetical protein
MIHCNGKGCNGALDCDNCSQSGSCDIHVYCDQCGCDCYDYYYEIDGEELCEDCVNELYRHNVENLGW